MTETEIIQHIQVVIQDSGEATKQRIVTAINTLVVPEIVAYYDWDWRHSDIQPLTTIVNQLLYDLDTNFDGMISVKDVTNEKLLGFYRFPEFDLRIVDETKKGNAEVFLITKDKKLQFYPVYDTAVTINYRYKIKTTNVSQLPEDFKGAVIHGTIMYVVPRVLADKTSPNSVYLEAKQSFYQNLLMLKTAFPKQSGQMVRFRLSAEVEDHLKNVDSIKDYSIGY